MKNKILLIIIVSSMVLSGLNVVVANYSNEITSDSSILKEKTMFSKANVHTNGEYVTLEVKETNDFLSIPGKPILPVFIKTYNFPFGTKIKDVTFIPSEVTIEGISGIIQPVPEPQLVTTLQDSKISSKKVEISPNYQDLGIYPEKWFEYSVKCGLEKGERTVFVIIHVYPVRYSPADDTIQSIDSFDIQITYDEPKNQEPKEPIYDLLIISHNNLLSTLQPLVTHKENMGISTTVKLTEEIYSEYSGRDKPEKIKYFIKDAIEQWGITYVLLFGARNHQYPSFLVPVRQSNLEDRSGWNETYVSDLYYADIYKGNGEFEDWDSNGNDIFAEWTWFWKPEWNWWSNDIKQKDEIDLFPDVYLGRIACKNTVEAKTIVSKIIKYETTSYGTNWFKRMACFGGDTSIGDDGYYEGEVQNALAASYLEPIGFDITNLWASDGTLVDYRDTVNIFNKGIGFVYMAGHGSPLIWCTHPPENETWVDGLYNKQMFLLRNYEKLPIVVIGGCHNSNYNVGFPHFFEGLFKLGLRYFEWIYDEECYDKLAWVPNTFSWALMIQWGGAIATIGNTGLGWVAPGEGCTGSLDGWINSHFFLTYSELFDDENCTLGMVHGDNLKSYIQTFSPNTNAKHRKTVEEWALLGDPTLKIGGYPS